MRTKLKPWHYLALAGGALGIGYLALSGDGEAKPDGTKARTFVGTAAQQGDRVDVDPTSLTNLFQVPAGVLAIVMDVSAASPDYLTGPVVGVLTPAGEQAFAGGSYTVPRSAVSRVRRGGQVVA
jgi:hypothetical protein